MLNALRRRLHDLPIDRKLACILAALIANLAAVIALAYFGMGTMSSLRAYVGGEGLWAKAQKDAILQLRVYARSGDEADYRAFEEKLRVPLGDRRARLALEKSPPDLAEADAGFIEGGNHPDDVRGMSQLFLRFGRVSHIRRAIGLWREADGLIDELRASAEGLRRAVRANARAEQLRRLGEIDRINARLTRVENDFSYSLGEASRWAWRVLLAAMIAGSLLVGGFSVYLTLLVSRAIVGGLHEVAEAAERASKGDLTVRAPVSTEDELGHLAAAFNRMVQGLAELDRLKSDFIATASHELRTPLTLALAPLESLLQAEYGPVSGEQRKVLTIMHNNAVRLLQIVNGLLDFARLESGKLEPRPEPVDAAELTRALAADFRPVAEGRGLTLAVDAPASGTFVRLDRYLYERVLFNLLSNALKFTPAGGRVEVRLERPGERLRLCVRDSGIGIEPRDQAQLFQKFRQLESSSTRRFEGTGLGLALVKEFSALMGGEVSVTSQPGKGSEFVVDVAAPAAGSFETAARPARAPHPIPLAERGTDAIELELEAGAASAEAEGAPRVLIAEDNPEMSAYLARLLRGVCATRAAADGESALALARAWKPDLVLTDVMMPRKDGLALCRELKADPELGAVPVVVITALTDRDSMVRGWEAGADEYLFKPFHPREVATRVRTMLAAIRSRRRAESALESKTKELQRSNAELEQFAFSASHDLQEPLRSIVSFSQLILRRHGASLDAEGKDFLRRVVDGGHRMQAMIDDLLKYSRVGRRGGPIRPVSSRAAVDQAKAGLAALIKESGAVVDSGELPVVMADGVQLVQLFQNLIGNAVKFRGKGVPEVRIAAEARGGEWEFSVRDNGIGIDQRYHERIFAIFERLHSRSEYPGSGIGLALCKKIVERHGGRIWVDSAPGKGSTFRFTLPAARETAAAA